MKHKILVFLLTILGTTAVRAQAVAPEEEADKQFIVLYTVGEGWDMDKAPREQVYFSDHSNHLAQLRKDGKILIGARYSETGMLILSAPDAAQAHEWIHSDLAIQHKLFDAEIHPWNPFYKGCIE